MRGLYIIVACLLFTACEKKELPAPKYDRGNVITQQVEMTSNYKNQVWYRLSDNSIVSTNNKSDWDLGFETSALGFYIILNSSKAMKAYKTSFVNLSQATDTVGLGVGGTADFPSGNLDSTAIGNWQTTNTVYIINRGYNEFGQHQGYYKLKINSATTSQYTFDYADIYSSTSIQGIVNKNEDYNFNMYSFTTNQQLTIEPKKSDYDLCFTQYSHVYYSPIHFYQVTGVLSNNHNTKVMRITDKPFSDIAISDTLNRVFSVNKNSIGYDWKTFDLNTNLFTVNPNINYIIKDSKGFYYKLHFIDFYSSSGVKGYPKFEFVKI
jgi:hypothetical protein